VNEREVDIEALFERDADSRLLERRRRTELGLAPHVPTSLSTASEFGAESIDPGRAAPSRRPALLRVELDARPSRELIPGAVATLVVTVANDGDVPVDDVLLRLAVPPEAEPVEGSFTRDDAPIDGETLLGEGQRIGAIAPSRAIRVRFALRVLPGTEALDVAVHASASAVPAVGTPTLRLQRRAGHTAYEQPKPFYELEDGEHDEEPALPATGPPSAPVRLVDVLVDEPLVQPAIEQPEFEQPAVTVEADTPESLVVSEPATLARAVTLERVRALERFYAGGVPHGLATLALLAATACSSGPLGEALRLEPFRASVAEALPRALVAARMGKPTPPVVTREVLDAIEAEASGPAGGIAFETPTLTARLDERDFTALQNVLRRDLDDLFLRGMQVLLAIAPRTIEGVDADRVLHATAALSAFRLGAGAWLMRVTVRRSVDRRYDPLTADDDALRDAGAALVTALREVLS
jgi:hypothetical protein